MDSLKWRMVLGAAVLLGAVAPAAAGGSGLEPAIAVIVSGTGASAGAAAGNGARRKLAARLRALGANVVGPAGVPRQAARRGVQFTALQTRAGAGATADLVIAVSVRSETRQGAYTRHLRLTLRADLYPASGAPARAFTLARQMRLRWTCREACTARRAALMAGEAAGDLAPRVFKKARALGPPGVQEGARPGAGPGPAARLPWLQRG